MTDVGLECRLDVLEAAEQRRYEALRAAMRLELQETRELPNGYAVRLTSDPTVFRQVAEWISLERRCCPFLGLALRWSENDAVWLELTGDPRVKAFLAARLGARE